MHGSRHFIHRTLSSVALPYPETGNGPTLPATVLWLSCTSSCCWCCARFSPLLLHCVKCASGMILSLWRFLLLLLCARARHQSRKATAIYQSIKQSRKYRRDDGSSGAEQGRIGREGRTCGISCDRGERERQQRNTTTNERRITLASES